MRITGEEFLAGTGYIGAAGAQNPIAAILAQQICETINNGLESLGVSANADVALQSVGTAAERGGREI